MSQKLDIYKCETCGTIVEVVRGGDSDLSCCDKPMISLEIHTTDQGKEKHVPVIEKTDKGIKVKVGDVPHPMEEKHFIEWIEIIDGDKAYRQFLAPGRPPEAIFDCMNDNVLAREHCNIHGLWKGGAK